MKFTVSELEDIVAYGTVKFRCYKCGKIAYSIDAGQLDLDRLDRDIIRGACTRCLNSLLRSSSYDRAARSISLVSPSYQEGIRSY